MQRAGGTYFFASLVESTSDHPHNQKTNRRRLLGTPTYLFDHILSPIRCQLDFYVVDTSRVMSTEDIHIVFELHSMQFHEFRV